MKIRMLTYRQVLTMYPEAVVKIGYRQIDASFPGHESSPVAEAPAIFVWPDKEKIDFADTTGCIAIFWLRDED